MYTLASKSWNTLIDSIIYGTPHPHLPSTLYNNTCRTIAIILNLTLRYQQEADKDGTGTLDEEEFMAACDWLFNLKGKVNDTLQAAPATYIPMLSSMVNPTMSAVIEESVVTCTFSLQNEEELRTFFYKIDYNSDGYVDWVSRHLYDNINYPLAIISVIFHSQDSAVHIILYIGKSHFLKYFHECHKINFTV